MARKTQEQIEQQIAEIERRMAREWRLFQRYSGYLVVLRGELQARLAAAYALAKKKAQQSIKRGWSAIEGLCARLRWFRHIEDLRVNMPGAYGWGIERNDAQVLED